MSRTILRLAERHKELQAEVRATLPAQTTSAALICAKGFQTFENNVGLKLLCQG